MRTTHFREFLVHLLPQKVGDYSWCPRALIEDPANGDVAFITMCIKVSSEQDANVKMMMEAHSRIQENTWRVHAGKKQTVPE